MSVKYDRVAVVIPCFRVSQKILKVLQGIGPEVDFIYVVDDACPEKSGELVQKQCTDQRVRVLFNSHNLGVGGAVICGYQAALADGAHYVVKLDGDGQMNTALIKDFVHILQTEQADYVKGNRFYDLESLEQMPSVRLLGNAVLSFISKVSSGYWNIMDPTNGYTAISHKVLRALPFDKLEKRYFFESDMLFRLNIMRAVVMDLPIPAVYGDQNSSLSIFKSIFEFSVKHQVRFFKRIFYTYYFRDFHLASLQLILGIPMCLWGVGFGAYQWHLNWQASNFASSGTVMLASLPIIVGTQLLISAVGFDIQNIPKVPLSRLSRS